LSRIDLPEIALSLLTEEATELSVRTKEGGDMDTVGGGKRGDLTFG
jgi:hypothetical protein